ncbi:phage GP46 family protein [Cupriavidus basilensis]|uniref:phage GP46 family protein n=1 Tax=Cupriavidus basilensis TaxID=68895 RepID=UPI0039F6DAC5
MDALLDPQTGGYTGTRTSTLANAVYLRLATPLGSYWADPTLGSRLHELAREKDVARVAILAKQYAEEALAPLVKDGRARSIVVETERVESGWLRLRIAVEDASGSIQHFAHPVKVV